MQKTPTKTLFEEIDFLMYKPKLQNNIIDQENSSLHKAGLYPCN